MSQLKTFSQRAEWDSTTRYLSSHVQILTFTDIQKRVLSCHRLLEHCFVVIASFAGWGDSVSHTEQNNTLPFLATPGVCLYYWLCVQSFLGLEIAFLSFYFSGRQQMKTLEANFVTVYHSICTTNLSSPKGKNCEGFPKKTQKNTDRNVVQKPLMDLSLQWVVPIYSLEQEEWKPVALVVSQG